MKSKKTLAVFAPHESQRFILPMMLVFVCVMVGVIIEHLLNSPAVNLFLVVYGSLAILYALINNALVLKTNNYREKYGFINALMMGTILGLFTYGVPANAVEASHIFIILGIVSVAATSSRFHSYITMALTLAISLPDRIVQFSGYESLLELATPYIISIVIVETLLRIKATTRQHIHRLETINKVSRQIMLSLETDQTISLLNATMQEALEADTYFVGIVKDNMISLDLFYDDGEYFNGLQIPLEGTLSGWVIKNQRELFLPDLRDEVELEGISEIVTGGKKRTSLSWIGVPLKASNVTGVISLGSYKPNAFDSGDMELLSNLAQHITLALDNTIRHSQVEEQARLDSMTGVYNHGYFLKKLAEQAQDSNNTQMSLIMLDIDYFKQYNDTFGHLVGDRILKTLCTAIKHHIKQTDTVGRWGGEEFVISLPGASGLEALRVAERIGETMALLQIEDREQKTIPVPTVSQGIAVFPIEADEIYRLIDLADRRLYMAKERGRNQIEPIPEHWENIPVK